MIHIQELKEQEAVHMLAFLREHMHAADELKVLYICTPRNIKKKDNRSVAHRAVAGGYDKSLREGKRTAIFGERPFYDPTGYTWSERFNSEVFRDNEGFDYAIKGGTAQ